MSKPKAVKAPPVAAPIAVTEDVKPAEDSEAKAIRRQMGYQRQLLTGALTPATGKKRVLG